MSQWQSLLEQASSLRRAGRIEEAIAAYQRLLAAKPELPDSWYNLGWLQRQAGRFEEALESYGRSLTEGVTGPEEVHLNRAVILSDHLGRPDEAEAELHRALELSTDYVPALLNLGNLAEDAGRKADARDLYERAMAADPKNILALARLAGVTDAGSESDPLVADLRRALAREDITPADRADLGFALGRLLDAAGSYDGAFEAYRAANAASRASMGPDFLGYDRAAQEALVDRLIRTFAEPSDSLAATPGGAPLFILGMFRSGSTLVERVLAAHSGVRAGGELDLMPQVAAELGFPRSPARPDEGTAESLRNRYLEGLERLGLRSGLVTDKRPDNFLHVGLIKALFPDAKIVHTLRNPLDNCLSLYFLHLSPDMAYALDLEDAAHWYGEYRRLMDHWKALYPTDIFDVDYDELVECPEQVLRSLVDFCGLAWEDECLNFATSGGRVRTASVWQVRQPLYRSSSGRWRNYRKQVEPLLKGLDAPGRE